MPRNTSQESLWGCSWDLQWTAWWPWRASLVSIRPQSLRWRRAWEVRAQRWGCGLRGGKLLVGGMLIMLLFWNNEPQRYNIILTVVNKISDSIQTYKCWWYLWWIPNAHLLKSCINFQTGNGWLYTLTIIITSVTYAFIEVAMIVQYDGKSHWIPYWTFISRTDPWAYSHGALIESV